MKKTLKTDDLAVANKDVLAVVYPNTWINGCGDLITRSDGYFDKRGAASCYTITIDGKYIKSVGGLNLAKKFINDHRNSKCKWVGSVE